VKDGDAPLRRGFLLRVRPLNMVSVARGSKTFRDIPRHSATFRDIPPRRTKVCFSSENEVLPVFLKPFSVSPCTAE
jgi:hypothetical protein